MGQIFHRVANPLAKLVVFGAPFALAGALGLVEAVDRSPYTTRVGEVRTQPVPFSHEHHVGDLGIDCRYCHQTVERSAFAGMPSSDTCMHCHAQIWNDSPMLRPIRESARTGAPIAWKRVYDLPDFVYFDHGIHVRQGVGCVTCHGRVDRMPLLRRTSSLHMEWCLGCHRHPERYVRPREAVFDMTWTPPAHRDRLGRALVAQYGIARRTDCITCHR